MVDLIILGFAVAATSMTISTTHACAWLRDYISNLGPLFKRLIHCPWCLSHWVALILASWFLKFEGILDWFVCIMAIVAISGLVSAGITYFFLALNALEGE
jgi:hypothetical protein